MNDIILFFFRIFGQASAVVFLALVAGIYLLPTIVGIVRRKRNLLNIAFFNIFLGWTVIAWGAMLVEAFTSDDAP